MNTVVCKSVFLVGTLTATQVYDMSTVSGQAKTTVVASVPGKTYTAEELEYMAALRAAETCDLPSALLVELAATYPPPAEWLDTEEEMPF